MNDLSANLCGKRFRLDSRAALPSLALALLAQGALPLTASTNEIPVRDLVASVANSRKTSGFRMRATLIRSASESRKSEARQITVRGRFEGGSVQVLYLCLAPALPDGQAVLIERKAGALGEVSLFLPPDRLAALSPDRFGQRLFGTDFTIGDMVEPFWTWPASGAPGETNLLGHLCMPVEFRNPANDAASPPSVRAWIAPDISLPLLVETFDKEGKPVRRLHSEKLIRRAGDVWAPMFVIAEDVSSGGKTTLAVRGGERDIEIPAACFTAEGIAKLMAEGDPTRNETR